MLVIGCQGEELTERKLYDACSVALSKEIVARLRRTGHSWPDIALKAHEKFAQQGWAFPSPPVLMIRTYLAAVQTQGYCKLVELERVIRQVRDRVHHHRALLARSDAPTGRSLTQPQDTTQILRRILAKKYARSRERPKRKSIRA